MVRISGGGLSAQNPYGPQWSGGASEAKSLGQQVQDNLFGKKKPPPVSADDAVSAALLGRLHAYRKKIARLAGDDDADYDITLCAGGIAMIDEQGLIHVGKDFLHQTSEHLGVQVGVLAHEIGHRPRRWGEYRQEQPRSKEELAQLCRLEETRADYFAGMALASLGIPVDPVCQFLKAVSVHPHPEYFPVPVRIEVIQSGAVDGARKQSSRAKLFPELARHMNPKLDLGSG